MIEAPHSITLEIPQDVELPEGFAGAPDSAGSVTLNVQITPKTPGYAFDAYGVTADRPHKMLGNVDDEPYFKMDGARVTWDINGAQKVLNIKGSHRAHLNGDDCDHVSVMLEEVNG